MKSAISVMATRWPIPLLTDDALNALNLKFEDATGHLFFNRTRLCIDATARGLGLAIVSDSIVYDHLSPGALVQLPGPCLSSRGQYYLLNPDTSSLSPRVRLVRDWLFKQASEPATAN